MMKNIRPIFLAAVVAAPLFSMPVMAQDACQATGQQVANERGATLLSATATEQNGSDVCEVVILQPASGGERPKREVVVVPR